MNNYEKIFKFFGVVLILGLNLLWLYNDKIEPYVNLVVFILAMFSFNPEIFNFRSINSNKSAVQKIIKIKKKEVSKFYKVFFLTSDLNGLVKLKKELEKRYPKDAMFDKKLNLSNIRRLESLIVKAIEYLKANQKVILILIGILINTILLSIKKQTKEKINNFYAQFQKTVFNFIEIPKSRYLKTQYYEVLSSL